MSTIKTRHSWTIGIRWILLSTRQMSVEMIQWSVFLCHYASVLRRHRNTSLLIMKVGLGKKNEREKYENLEGGTG